MKKNRLLAILISIVICLGACVWLTNNMGINTNAEDYQDYEFGFTKEQYICSLDITYDDEMIKIADGILDNMLTVHFNLDAMEYDLETLDWNVQYTESPNTFQLYLQCLNPVLYLTRAYEINGNQEYLEVAEKLILSWNDYLNNPQISQDNPFLWYDHGTALRAENLIYYAVVADEAGLLKNETKALIVELLNQHAEFLSDEENYTENHNHGIFQDTALIYIAYFLDNGQKQEWLEIAEERLESQKNYAFTSEMVHVENSPGYQIGVMDLFRVISEFIIQFGDEYGQNLYSDVKQSAEFMAYVMKPNGYAAEIGDTNGSVNTSASKNVGLDVFGNDHLTYAATLGEAGSMPEESSKIYPKSGYYLSHNSWEKENYVNSTWVMFKSGYSSKTHKHADDNSIMLYSKGYDIFSDTGWYNYVTGNRYRDYFVSSLAHNTVVVDEKTYSATTENSYKTGIFDYKQSDDYDYVAGFNDMYEGVMFDRHFYNLGDAFIIYDDLISKDEHTYSQLFHLPEYNEVIEHSDNEVIIQLADSGYNVRLKQLSENVTLDVIQGDFEDAKYGYISHCMNNLESTTTLKFNKIDDNAEFITLITIEDQDGKVVDLNDIQFTKDKKSFEIRKLDGTSYRIDLKSRERIQMDNISVSKTGDKTFDFSNNYVNKDVTYAWYVIDKASATPIFKSEFSEENEFEYTFEEQGEYLIKSYVQDQYGQRKQSIIADIKYDDKTGEWIDATNENPYLNLVYYGHHFEKLSDTKYIFTVDYDYSWTSEIVWYVYKNGAYYANSKTENENTLEFEFTEDGKYTIIYYLKTPNGNNEFWNFEEIEIEG